jgi:hypothetical protein
MDTITDIKTVSDMDTDMDTDMDMETDKDMEMDMATGHRHRKFANVAKNCKFFLLVYFQKFWRKS